jgi:hypothetical protein
MNDTKIVFSASVARHLLKKGFQIVDIKPNNKKPDASVFVFRNSSLFMDELHKLVD